MAMLSPTVEYRKTAHSF